MQLQPVYIFEIVVLVCGLNNYQPLYPIYRSALYTCKDLYTCVTSAKKSDIFSAKPYPVVSLYTHTVSSESSELNLVLNSSVRNPVNISHHGATGFPRMETVFRVNKTIKTNFTRSREFNYEENNHSVSLVPGLVDWPVVESSAFDSTSGSTFTATPFLSSIDLISLSSSNLQSVINSKISDASVSDSFSFVNSSSLYDKESARSNIQEEAVIRSKTVRFRDLEIRASKTPLTYLTFGTEDTDLENSASNEIVTSLSGANTNVGEEPERKAYSSSAAFDILFYGATESLYSAKYTRPVLSHVSYIPSSRNMSVLHTAPFVTYAYSVDGEIIPENLSKSDPVVSSFVVHSKQLVQNFQSLSLIRSDLGNPHVDMSLHFHDKTKLTQNSPEFVNDHAQNIHYNSDGVIPFQEPQALNNTSVKLKNDIESTMAKGTQDQLECPSYDTVIYSIGLPVVVVLILIVIVMYQYKKKGGKCYHTFSGRHVECSIIAPKPPAILRQEALPWQSASFNRRATKPVVLKTDLDNQISRLSVKRDNNDSAKRNGVCVDSLHLVLDNETCV